MIREENKMSEENTFSNDLINAAKTNNKNKLVDSFKKFGRLFSYLNKFILGSEGVIGFRDYLLSNKFSHFLEGFFENNVTKDEIDKYIEKYDKDCLEEEINYLFNILNICCESYQAKRLGYLFVSCLKGKISKDVFYELAQINCSLLEIDLQILLEKEKITNTNEYKCDRLASIGLFKKELFQTTNRAVGYTITNEYSPTELGRQMKKVLIEFYVE